MWNAYGMIDYFSVIWYWFNRKPDSGFKRFFVDFTKFLNSGFCQKLKPDYILDHRIYRFDHRSGWISKHWLYYMEENV